MLILLLNFQRCWRHSTSQRRRLAAPLAISPAGIWAHVCLSFYTAMVLTTVEIKLMKKTAVSHNQAFFLSLFTQFIIKKSFWWYIVFGVWLAFITALQTLKIKCHGTSDMRDKSCEVGFFLSSSKVQEIEWECDSIVPSVNIMWTNQMMWTKLTHR